MPQYTALQIRTKKQMAKKVVEHHFGKTIRNIEFNAAGRTKRLARITTSLVSESIADRTLRPAIFRASEPA